MPTRPFARTAALVVAALVAVVMAAVVMAGSAHAAAYRYWTYWQGGTGTWSFATAGPAATVPADGSVEGWRFAVTTAAGGTSDAPTIAPSFEAICEGTPARADRKRVALVIDPGTAAIAPDGQVPPAAGTACVVIEPDATGYQILRFVATVRTEDGLICAIADYPSGECAPVIDEAATGTDSAVDTQAPADAAYPSPAAATAMDPGPAPAAQPSSGGPWLTAGVLAIVAVVGVLLWRRRVR